MVHHRGSSQIMWDVSATLAVLLLVLDAAVFSSARNVVDFFPTGPQPRRGLSQSSEPRTVALALMHADLHVNSPSMQPNLTVLERAQNAVKKSKQRLRYFSSTILGKKAEKIGVNHVLSTPVYSGQTQYIMEITLGTPARTFVVSMDTGSDLIWVQCRPCTACFTQPDPIFDPTASSSYTVASCTGFTCSYLPAEGSYPACDAENTCLYSYTYGDQSVTRGSMAFETFTLALTDGSTQLFEVAFGCGTSNTGLFGPNIDGLVGLGLGPLALPWQLGANVAGVFSYCLVDYYAAKTRTSPLLLGSAGSIELTYTPLLSNSVFTSFYYVDLIGITVGGEPVDYPADTFTIDPDTGVGGFILDSGTTLTYLFEAAYQPFIAAIDSLVTYPAVSVSAFDLCYDTSAAASAVFPDVVFQFDGVDVATPSNNIFLPVDTQNTIYCLYLSSAGSSDGISIFGNLAQQNFQVAYDINNARVGFAPTSC